MHGNGFFTLQCIVLWVHLEFFSSVLVVDARANTGRVSCWWHCVVHRYFHCSVDRLLSLSESMCTESKKGGEKVMVAVTWGHHVGVTFSFCLTARTPFWLRPTDRGREEDGWETVR
jgi:hypothetical protein